MWFILVSLVLIVAYKMLTGRINMVGLLGAAWPVDRDHKA